MGKDSALQEVSLLGTGDCGPTLGPKDGFPIQRYTELVRPTLQSVDLRFGNCERQYSARKGEATGPGMIYPHGCQPPEMAQIFTDCGFDALTIANNHMYDFGPGALLDTRALLQEKGIAVTGAGKDLAEARLPAIVECKGVKVGFLGYNSIIEFGGEAGIAGVNRPGVSPLRVKTYLEARGPHASPRVWTEPHEGDLTMIVDDVKALRKRVDAVIVAFHWGSDWIPRVVSDYQVIAAHACIDAGADMIHGNHPHVPKGIEVYKDKAIFYCMGSLVMNNQTGPQPAWREPAWAHGALRNYTDLDPVYPLMPYGKNTNKSILVKAILTKSGVKRVSFLPLLIDSLYRPEVLHQGDRRFDEVVQFMDWSSEDFNHKFTVEGDEVVVDG